MVEFESKRTIEEVLDFETGEIILSKDFFKQPEDKIIAFRRLQQEAISGIRTPKFICYYCHQIVKISGKPTQRGIVSFFAHLHDSEECEIKTNGDYSKEEIEAIKYASVKESLRHIDLKGKIYKALTYEKSKEIGINNVEIEKRFTSDNPLLNWRRPDVYAEFNTRKVVFELQLSTTFLSVIVARDIFYKLNNTFIIWIFNFSSNEEYVNLGNLMCKDIYYANKRNAFVYDEKAVKLSEIEKELVLLCIWFEPIIEYGQLVPGRGSRRQEYIKFSELNFDDKEFKPYYVDADKMFSTYSPGLLLDRTKKAREAEEWLKKVEKAVLKKIEKNKVEKEVSGQLQKTKINEIIKGIEQGIYKLNPIQENGKWGYESQGELIIKPIYSFVSKYGESGFAKVERGMKSGLLNKVGKKIVPCIYDFIEPFRDGMAMVKKNNLWGYIDVTGNEIIHCNFNFIGRFQDGIAQVTRDNLRGYVDMMGSEIIPCSFNEIEPFQDGKAKAKKNHLWGYIDVKGSEIIPCNFNFIAIFNDGKVKVNQNDLWGYFDTNGNTLINIIYQEIQSVKNGLYKIKRSNKWGYIDYSGKLVVDNIYDYISDFNEGATDIRQNDKIVKVYDLAKYIFLDNKGYVDKMGREYWQYWTD